MHYEIIRVGCHGPRRGVQQGKHPSVDAVRVALSNTGSKTTIHRYLKEL
ncbi:DNA-binding protein [Xanthomonas translucens pv. translucens]|uniref:DNA-binding protein n=1 Tax=Xanthomonas translucens pv. translucens TaxID=134875 RepID=A0ABW9KS93_XANCT